jgi:Undecaprenyl-phosphate glucose phosphotransferase
MLRPVPQEIQVGGTRDVVAMVNAKENRMSSVEAASPTPSARELNLLARALAAQPVARPISPVVLSGTVHVVELMLIVLSGTVIHAFYIYPYESYDWAYAWAIAAVSLASIATFQAMDLYKVTAFRSHFHQLGRIAFGWTIVFLLAFAIAFFAKFEGTFSRVWAGAWFMTGLGLLFAERSILTMLVRLWARQGRLVRRVSIVGGGAPGEALVEALRSESDSDVQICGVFDDRGDQRSQPVVAGVPKLGTVDDLIEFTRRTRVDLIMFSLPLTAEERVLQMARKLWILPVDIRLAAHMHKLRFRPRAYSYVGGVPVFDIFDKPLADWNIVLKSAFDRIAGWLLLVAALPVMGLIALAVKLDSRGPALFKQKRYGFNNDLIEVYKFRSMYTDKTDATAARLVTKDDPRVTRIGRLLRKTSLDELPQLINVAIKGNLSLVGPRPHAVHAKAEHKLYDETVDGYFARHRVKPGMTGWAQVNGWRGETDTREKIQRRVEHDLYYIENWSLFFDIYIIARTPFALLKTENAY